MRRIVDVEPDISLIAAAISQPARCAILQALMGAVSLPASELAYRAGVSNSTASSHLNMLVGSGAIAVCKCGRHRYYKLSHPRVAELMEAFSLLAPQTAASKPARKVIAQKLRHARLCYDHLAGQLGVSVTEAMLTREYIVEERESFELSLAGEAFLKSELQIHVVTLRNLRRPLTRSCLDWSERRPHLAGAIGAAIATRFIARKWVAQNGDDRSLAVTSRGRSSLLRLFDLRLASDGSPPTLRSNNKL